MLGEAHSVNDVRHVEVLQSTEELVEQVGDAVVVQFEANHTRQVGIHCLHHYVSARGGEGRGRERGGEGRGRERGGEGRASLHYARHSWEH